MIPQRMGPRTRSRSRRERILAVAYAATPGAGSEPGAGWMWCRLLATFGETWVLTRAVSEEERKLRATAVARLGVEGRLHFVDVDLPSWTSIWRIGRPGKTRFQRLEYLLWLILAMRRARRLHRARQFDLAWHLTWANTLGSPVAYLGIPLVIGPIGGAVQPPWRLVADLGVRAILFELIRALGQWLIRHANPLGRRSWERAQLVLVQNHETYDWLPADARGRAVVFPNAVLETIPERESRPPHNPPRALFAGLLSPWKGANLALRAITLLPDWELLVCGDGPDAPRLRSLAHRLGVADRVRFLGWQPRTELWRLMREEADVFLFPSLHDEGPWVVVEALAAGLPVISLDRGGPPVLGAEVVHATSRGDTVRALAVAARRAIGQRPPPPSSFSFEAKREGLAEILQRFGLLDVGPG